MYNLYPYQLENVGAVYSNWKIDNKKVLLISPPRSGKTIMSGKIIEDALQKGYEVLFTVHRELILEQTYQKYKHLKPSVIMGSDKRYNPDAKLQIASLLTLKNRDVKTPRIIIMDEIHWGHNSDIIQDIFKRFPDSYFLGLSATPTDQKNFQLEGWDSYLDKYQIKELMDMGYLVPFKDGDDDKIYAPISVDLREIKISNTGDYNEKELELKMIEDALITTVYDNYMLLGENKQFICHTTGRVHGTLLAEIFAKNGIEVGYIDSKVSKKERKRIYSEFEAGTLRGIFGIYILTTGLDLPMVACVIDAAPTKISSKYYQGAMRGNTPNGKDKKYCIYIDCANNIIEHGMPHERQKKEFKPIISKVIDRELNLIEDIEERNEVRSVIKSEKFLKLKKIGKLLDLYDGKIYTKESELQSDINKFLEKTGLFTFRQNSGAAQFGWALDTELRAFAKYDSSHDANSITKFIKFIKAGTIRWVRFTSKSGLADNSVFYNIGSIFFGIELKMPHGKLTKHQEKTFPEMVRKGVLLFFAQSVIDVYGIIMHIENNVSEIDSNIIIKKEIYNLPDTQIRYYRRHKLKTYIEVKNERM